jgi:hypothetical protein
MTRQKRRIVLLSGFALSLMLGGLGITGYHYFGQSQPVDPGKTSPVEVESQDIDSIKFAAPVIIKDSQGHYVTTVSYTLNPENADLYGFNEAFFWNMDASDVQDSTWDGTQTISDYVTYQINYEAKNVTFTNLQPFGRELKFTITSKADMTKSGYVKLNYVRRLLTDPVYSCPSAIENVKSLQVTYTDAVFSVGSKGNRTTARPTLAVTYEDNGGAGRSLASLVDDITQIGNSYSYITYAYYNNGAETNDFAAVKAAMVQQVSDYIASLISSQGDSTVPTFDQDHLRSLLTYRYVSYYSYKNNWVDYTQIYYDFIRAYQANATEALKTGFYASATYEGREDLHQHLDLSITPDGVTGLGFDESTIDF